MLVIVLVGLGVGTLISALASSIALVIVGRIVQGTGGAIFPLAFGIIRDEFPPHRVAAGIGIISSILGIGSGAGIVLAGPIIVHLSYHWLFWIPLVMIVVATIATFVYIPESPIRADGRINWLGAVLLAGWLTAGLLALSKAPVWGWTSGTVVLLFAVTVMLIGLWIWAEMRADHPVVDMKMMRIRAVWTTNLAALLFGFGMFSMFIVAPQFVQTPVDVGYGFGASVTKAGLFLAPLSLAMLLVAPLIGRLTAAVGAKSLLVAGGGFGAVSYFLLAAEHNHQWSFYAASALLGVGVALGFASMANLIIEAVPASQTGVATGMNTNIRSIGGALGSAIATSIIVMDVLPSGLPKEGGFVVAFVACGVSMVVACLAALAVPGRSRPDTQAAGPPRPVEADVMPGPAYLSGTHE
jgi:MFS family permease